MTVFPYCQIAVHRAHYCSSTKPHNMNTVAQQKKVVWTGVRLPIELHTQLSVRVAQERTTVAQFIQEAIYLRLAQGVKENAA